MRRQGGELFVGQGPDQSVVYPASVSYIYIRSVGLGRPAAEVLYFELTTALLEGRGGSRLPYRM